MYYFYYRAKKASSPHRRRRFRRGRGSYEEVEVEMAQGSVTASAEQKGEDAEDAQEVLPPQIT